MERTSDQHGPKQDEEIKQGLDGLIKGDHPTRVEQELDAEPPADDDPTVVGWDPRDEPAEEKQAHEEK